MKKRVILLTIDCLRQDYLKTYGYHKQIAPNIEILTKNAVVFENAIANGNCTPPSFYSLFTSTLPTTEGIYAPLPTFRKKIAEGILEGVKDYLKKVELRT